MIDIHLLGRSTARSMLVVSVGVAAMVAPQHASAESAVSKAKSMVLTRQAVGTGFDVHEAGFTRAELAKHGTWSIEQLDAWGYQGGYERVFKHDIKSKTRAKQISSNAGVYATARGANDALIANGNACTVSAWKVLPSPNNLGDEAVSCTQTRTRGGRRGRLYFLAWRVGRFKGSISLSGIDGRVNSAEALKLARLQAVKM